jgi:hypothetical protein
MTTDTLSCVLGLTSQQLAAWRDEAVANDEAERIRTHVPGCVACQAGLAEWETLDTAIRAQWVPEPSPALWRDLQAARTHRSRPHGTSSRRRLLGTLTAAAAVILVVASFARLLLGRFSTVSVVPLTVGAPLPLATVAPAAFPEPGTPLVWQPVALLPGTATSEHISVAFSPASASHLYACRSSQAPGASPTVWVSHDHGEQWSQLADLPITGVVSDCVAYADQQNPNVVLIDVLWSPDGASIRSTDFMVEDGGPWHELPTWHSFAQPTTLGSALYVRVWDELNGELVYRLVVSHDGLRTWQYLDERFLAADLELDDYWVNPATGAVLVEAGPRPPPGVALGTPPQNASRTLWETDDDGRHWTQLPAPDLSGFTVQRATGSEPWRICGVRYDTSAASANPNVLACTSDGGRTWTARPGLRLPVCPTAHCAGQGTIPRVADAMLAADGALLALGPTGASSSGVIQRVDGYAIYRLPPGSTQWESLGVMPVSDVGLSGDAGSSLLWAVSYTTSPETLVRPGTIPTFVAGNGQILFPLYVAAYR